MAARLVAALACAQALVGLGARALVPPAATRVGARGPTRRFALPLDEIVRRKLVDVEALHKEHASGVDSDVRARLAFAATDGRYAFSAAMRRGDGRVAVVADVKRASPHGGVDGAPAALAKFGDASGVAAEVAGWPVDALSVCADGLAYGGAAADVAAARKAATTTPVLYKDFVVDPIQVAVAAELGCDAVLLIAAVLGARLGELLDACTLCGVEAAVEVHTPNEVSFAVGAGATLLVCSNRDRVTGELHAGQALGLRDLAPPNVVCVAAGGVDDAAEARALAIAGYDAVLVGRALLADPARGRALATAIRAIEVAQPDLLGGFT